MSLAEEPRPTGEASPLWLQAHAACHGARDEMWDYLEARYLDMARLLIDMAEWIEYAHEHVETRYATDEAVYESLLARFAELDGQAKEGT